MLAHRASLRVRIYSASGNQQAAISIPVSSTMGGTGNWIWTAESGVMNPPAYEGVVSVYSVNSGTPALTVSPANLMSVAPSGTSLALLFMDDTFRVIDLSGSTPQLTDYTIPPVNHASVVYPGSPSAGNTTVGAFAAASANRWVASIGGQFGPSGLILDGASLPSTTPRYLGKGAALSIAGSSNNAAIATGSGQIYFFDPANPAPQGSVGLTSANIQLSSDGSVLAASAQDRSLLSIDSLPSGALIHTFSYSSQSAPGLLSSYSLSGSGTTVAQIERFGSDPVSINYPLQITSVSGSPTILSLTLSPPPTVISGPLPEVYPAPAPSVLLSPDGTLAAVNLLTIEHHTGYNLYLYSVPIYQNGHLIATLGDVAVGWLDNGRLLLNHYASDHLDPSAPGYSGCSIVNPTGVTVGSCSLPEWHSIQPVSSDQVYVPGENAIYSLTTGQVVWTSPYPQDGSLGSHQTSWMGAVSGPWVVYESGGLVIAVMY